MVWRRLGAQRSSPAATAVTAAGTREPATWPRSAQASKFHCFYLYPTNSLAKTANTAVGVTEVATQDFCNIGGSLDSSSAMDASE